MQVLHKRVVIDGKVATVDDVLQVVSTYIYTRRFQPAVVGGQVAVYRRSPFLFRFLNLGTVQPDVESPIGQRAQYAVGIVHLAFGLLLLLAGGLGAAAAGLTDVDTSIGGQLHQGAKGNHALAFFQAVGKLLVALVAFVAWVLTANQVITLACPLAKRGTGKGNGHPRLVIAGKVGTAVGNAAGHELKVLKVGK